MNANRFWLSLAAVPVAGLVAVNLVIESGALSAEHVLNMLARLTAAPQPESVETTLQLKEAPLANTSRYDSLRGLREKIREHAHFRKNRATTRIDRK